MWHFKQGNDANEDDGYKLSNVKVLFAQLAQHDRKPETFSLLNLTVAFNQQYLDDESAKLLVLNTHKWLVVTKHLSFRVKSAPAKFQAVMDKILSGINGVYIY